MSHTDCGVAHAGDSRRGPAYTTSQTRLTGTELCVLVACRECSSASTMSRRSAAPAAVRFNIVFSFSRRARRRARARGCVGTDASASDARAPVIYD